MKIFLTTLIILFIPALACSETWYVPDDFPAIQIAINSPRVVNGDTVIVRAGTYYENIDFLGKAITLRSESGPDVTTIDGQSIFSVVIFQNDEGLDSVIEGFRITNGSTYNGGGVYCDFASPTIKGNIIENNEFTNEGGGICCRGGFASITGNVITGNIGPSSGPQGGGISLAWGFDGVVTDNVISGNEVVYQGGGIYCRDCGGLVARNRIEDNLAFYGGGIYCYDDVFTVIQDNIIARNVADYSDGGGIHCHYNAEPVVDGNVIRENRANNGGGIYVSWATPRIYNNVITDNTAVGYNGHYGDGGGIYCNNSSPPIVGNLIADNSAVATAMGGGIAFIWCKYARVVNNMIHGNFAGYGGGVAISNSAPRLAGNSVVDNSADVQGGGLMIVFDSEPEVFNTIIWDNSAPADTEIARVGIALPRIAYCDVKGGWPGYHNINADPLFVDAAGGDYHLTYQSPCRDAGNESALPPDTDVDFEGDPRIAEAEVDIGADEYYPHVYYSGTAAPGSAITLNVIGRPGIAPVHLARGYGYLDPPRPTQHGLLRIQTPPAELYTFGAVPADGVLRVAATVPLSWQTGEEYYYQALTGPWGGPSSILTNLMTIEVE